LVVRAVDPVKMTKGTQVSEIDLCWGVENVEGIRGVYPEFHDDGCFGDVAYIPEVVMDMPDIKANLDKIFGIKEPGLAISDVFNIATTHIFNTKIFDMELLALSPMPGRPETGFS
jgi:hypothetical protein